jgi:TRAP-type C4-dicarboxylate transport system permease small subunit
MAEANHEGILSGAESRLKTVASWFAIISAIALFGMMFLTAIDVFGRWLFARPLFGAYELIGTLLIIAGPFAMAITQLDRKHISVSIVVDLLPATAQKIFQSIGLLLDVFIYGMITAGLFVLSFTYWQRGIEAASEDLGFSLAIPAICYAFAALLYTLVLIIHFIQTLHKIGKKV